jgi:hypothetical protein
MKTLRQLAGYLLISLTAIQVHAQQQDASVVFKFSWKYGKPSDYIVTLHRSGQVDYVSDDRSLSSTQERNQPVESNAEQSVQTSDAASQDRFTKQFQATETVREKVFALAEQVKYFDGQFDFTAHPIAQTGSKTLAYQDPTRHTSTTYNYSENPSIQALTEIFQGISLTIESGRKLDFDRRFDKLSLDQDLKALDALSKDGHLYEVQAIAPMLQRLAADRTVLHIAQQTAQRILVRAGLAVAPSSSQ